jgi:hypothetical protein
MQTWRQLSSLANLRQQELLQFCLNRRCDFFS